jgi:hypothetical protein
MRTAVAPEYAFGIGNRNGTNNVSAASAIIVPPCPSLAIAKLLATANHMEEDAGSGSASAAFQAYFLTTRS